MRRRTFCAGVLFAAATFGPASTAAAKGGCNVRPSAPARIAAPAGEGFADQGWIRTMGRFRCTRPGRRTVTLERMFVTVSGRVVRGPGALGITNTYTRPMPHFLPLGPGESPCVATLQR